MKAAEVRSELERMKNAIDGVRHAICLDHEDCRKGFESFVDLGIKSIADQCEHDVIDTQIYLHDKPVIATCYGCFRAKDRVFGTLSS